MEIVSLVDLKRQYLSIKEEVDRTVKKFFNNI